MRTADEVRQCLSLHEAGVSAKEISRRVGVPRSTVRDWVAGRAPRSASAFTGGTCETCGEASHPVDDLPASYLYLLGIYLGDGCISAHARGVFRLRAFLDARYPRIVDEVVAAIEAVRPGNRVGRTFHPSSYAEAAAHCDSCVVISSYSKAWPCLIPQHGTGKKHSRAIVLAGWQTAIVRRRPPAVAPGSDPLRRLSFLEHRP